MEHQPKHSYDLQLVEHLQSLLGRELSKPEQDLMKWMDLQEGERAAQFTQLLLLVHNMGFERGQLSIDVDGAADYYDNEAAARFQEGE